METNKQTKKDTITSPIVFFFSLLLPCFFLLLLLWLHHLMCEPLNIKPIQASVFPIFMIVQDLSIYYRRAKESVVSFRFGNQY